MRSTTISPRSGLLILAAFSLSVCAEDLSAAFGRSVRLHSGHTKKAAEINRTATMIHVRHALIPGKDAIAWQDRFWKERQSGDRPSDPPVIARYTFNYTDGESIPVNVRLGESIACMERDNFFSPRDGFFRDMLWASIATHVPSTKGAGQVQTLYEMRLPNPRPNQKISTIDLHIETKADWGEICIYEVTAENPATAGRSLFVSPNGKDDNNGSYEKPWASPAKAFAEAQAGDTVYFRGGRYEVNKRLMLANSGRKDAWITLSAFPGETPLFDYAGFGLQGETPVTNWDPLGEGQLQIGNRSFVRVQGLRLENLIASGITAGKGESVDVAFNTIYNAYHSAMFLGGKNIRAIGNLIVWACRTQTLFDFANTYPDIKNSPHIQTLLAGHKKGKTYRHECLDIGVSGSDGLECAYNEVAYGNKESIDCKGGPINVKIHHNFVHHTTMTTALYIDAWTRPMKNVEVFRNIAYRNRGTGIAVASEGGSDIENIFIRDNLSIENGWSGILMSSFNADGMKRNLRIENNLCIGNGTNLENPNGQGGIHLGTETIQGAFVRGNICVNNRDYGIGTDVVLDLQRQQILIDDNLIYPPSQAQAGPMFPDKPELARWILLPGTSVISTEPQFADPEKFNYRLRPGSPAPRGSGTSE